MGDSGWRCLKICSAIFTCHKYKQTPCAFAELSAGESFAFSRFLLLLFHFHFQPPSLSDFSLPLYRAWESWPSCRGVSRREEKRWKNGKQLPVRQWARRIYARIEKIQRQQQQRVQWLLLLETVEAHTHSRHNTNTRPHTLTHTNTRPANTLFGWPKETKVCSSLIFIAYQCQSQSKMEYLKIWKFEWQSEFN